MRDQRGMSIAVEAAVVLPVLVLLIGLVIVLAGQALVQQHVEAAAYQAARAASLETNVAQAERSAKEAVALELDRFGIACVDPHLHVDAAGLRAPFGAQAEVVVELSCVAKFPVSLPGIPAERVITASGRSPVDTYRSRDDH